VRSAFDWSSSDRPVSVRSSGGALARLLSADQTASFTSGVTATSLGASSAAIHSAAQARSLGRRYAAAAGTRVASPASRRAQRMMRAAHREHRGARRKPLSKI
jgi:hypothetical protein